MPEYRLIEVGLVEKLVTLLEEIERSPGLTIEGSKTELPHMDLGIKKKWPRKTLSDLIYEKVTLDEFSPKQAYEIIAPFFRFRSGRYLDSIRVALKDERFARSEDGLYHKAK